MEMGWGEPPVEKGEAFLLQFEIVKDFLGSIQNLTEKNGKDKIWIDLRHPEVDKYDWTETNQPRHSMKGLIKTRIGKDSHRYGSTFTVPSFADDLIIESWDWYWVSVERNSKKARKKRSA